MQTRTFNAPIGILLLLLISGCTPFAQYRTRYELCTNPDVVLSKDCEKHALQQVPTGEGPDYLLAFIEFDDQGQLWDRKQMRAILNRYELESSGQDLLMVAFVHGWKHSAAPGDGNIETFRKVLARLSLDEAQISRQTGKPARRVAGLYLGWRGGTVSVPVVEDLTFWERKNTAQKVGHGGMTEVLSRLEQIKRDKDSVEPPESRATRLVVIGHSFGGAVVHNALGQILESRFVRTVGPAGVQSDVEGFGNLVLLINPAFEASQFAALSDMSAERGSYFKTQLPVIAILTSEADYATRYAFPAGRTLSTLFEKTHDTARWNAVGHHEEAIAENEANVSAVGHFAPYRTHRLYPVKLVDRGSTSVLTSNESLRSALLAAASWENDHPGSKIPFADLILERTATSAGRNPNMVIYVDRQLIADHNDIDDERIIEFIKQLILISTLSKETRATASKAMQIAPMTH